MKGIAKLPLALMAMMSLQFDPAIAESQSQKPLDDFSSPVGLHSEPLDKADNSKSDIDAPFTSSSPGPSIELSRSVLAVTSSRFRVVGRVSDDLGVAFVNVNGDEASLDSDGNFSSNVLLAIGKNTIEIEAVNVRNVSTSKSLTITRSEQAVTFMDEESDDEFAPDELVIDGIYYALLIGVQDYPDQSLVSLKEPVADVRRLAEVLAADYLFDEQHITILENPARAQIIGAMDDLSKRLTMQDSLLVFYAGHGYWDEQFEQGYWLPKDARQHSREAWIANGTIRDYIRGIPSRHTLLISDACFSGGIFRTRTAFKDAPVSVKRLYQMPSRRAMTSGSLTEVPDRSVFVKYLVKFLQTNQKHFVSSAALFNGFRTTVINNSPLEQIPQYGEIRNAGDEGGDFLFIRRQ